MRQNKIQNLLFAFLLAVTSLGFASGTANAGSNTTTPTGTEQTAAPAQAVTGAAGATGTAAAAAAATTNSGAASSAATTAPLPAPRAATGSQNGKKSGIGNAIADLLAANPECAELSNNCQICIRKNASNVACSTPGIACARGTWSCTKIQINP